MSDRTAFDLWERAVRRCLRDWVRDNGMVPSLCAFASKGPNPRKVNMLPRLDLLPPGEMGRAAVREHVSAHVRRYGSLFAAVGGTTLGQDQLRDEESSFDARFALVLVSGEEIRKVAASVGAEGLGAWRPSGFHVGSDLGFVQKALEAIPRAGA